MDERYENVTIGPQPKLPPTQVQPDSVRVIQSPELAARCSAGMDALLASVPCAKVAADADTLLLVNWELS